MSSPSLPSSPAAAGFCRRACHAALRCGRSDRMERIAISVAWLFNLALCASMNRLMEFNDEQWTVSMAHAAKFLAGERNYSNIQGPNGEPLLHPAGHSFISVWLYYLTGGGEDTQLARIVFGALYMATLALTMASYQRVKMGYLVYFQMGLSAKLFEIYLARCSIDCFAVFFLWLTILSFQRGSWTAGAVAFALALSISSYMMVAIPAVAIVTILGQGAIKTTKLLSLVVLCQVILSYPFTTTEADMASYLSALYRPDELFDYGRSIWSFLPECSYNSHAFACTLGVLLGATMTAFAAYPWLKPTGQSLPSMLRNAISSRRAATSDDAADTSSPVTPEHIADTMQSALVLSSLFLPSFPPSTYAYIAWGTPALLQGVECIGSGTMVYVLGIQHVVWSYFPRWGNYGAMILVACQLFPLGVSFLKAFVHEERKPLLPQRQEFADEKQSQVKLVA